MHPHCMAIPSSDLLVDCRALLDQLRVDNAALHTQLQTTVSDLHATGRKSVGTGVRSPLRSPLADLPFSVDRSVGGPTGSPSAGGDSRSGARLDGAGVPPKVLSLTTPDHQQRQQSAAGRGDMGIRSAEGSSNRPAILAGSQAVFAKEQDTGSAVVAAQSPPVSRLLRLSGKCSVCVLLLQKSASC